jgi:hypothetical protein
MLGKENFDGQLMFENLSVGSYINNFESFLSLAVLLHSYVAFIESLLKQKLALLP